MERIDSGPGTGISFRGKLVDGARWNGEKGTIRIRNGRIAVVGADRPGTLDDPGVVDLGDRVIMPGLIDTHVHLWGVRTMDYFHRLVVPEGMNLLRAGQDLGRLIDAGYTSIRDCGSRGGVFLRNAVEEGTLRGPRIKTSRLILTQTGGHADKHFIPLEEAKGEKTFCRIADGPDDCMRAVREQFREGADFVKICVTGGLTGEKESAEETQFSEEEIKVIVQEAAKKNSMISAHAFALGGVRKAVELGIHTIEHGVLLDEAVCGEMVRKGVYLVPTLTISYKFAVEGERYGSPPWAVEKAKKILDIHVKSFQLAHRCGVKMSTGTDFSGAPMLPHGENALELELMVKAGFSEKEAIQSATLTAGEVLGVEDLGTLEPGKRADLLVVDGNPLSDIRILQQRDRIELVMKEGDILKDRIGLRK